MTTPWIIPDLESLDPTEHASQASDNLPDFAIKGYSSEKVWNQWKHIDSTNITTLKVFLSEELHKLFRVFKPGSISTARGPYRYQDICLILSEYILSKKDSFFAPGNIRLCWVRDDPLGTIFGVRKFYREEVSCYLKSQLIIADDQEAPPVNPQQNPQVARIAPNNHLPVIRLVARVEPGQGRPPGQQQQLPRAPQQPLRIQIPPPPPGQQLRLGMPGHLLQHFRFPQEVPPRQPGPQEPLAEQPEVIMEPVQAANMAVPPPPPVANVAVPPPPLARPAMEVAPFQAAPRGHPDVEMAQRIAEALPRPPAVELVRPYGYIFNSGGQVIRVSHEERCRYLSYLLRVRKTNQ